MKKLIVMAGLLSVVATATYAKTGTTTPNMVSVVNEDNKTKIDPATLPDAVKTTLAGEAYKDWKIASAWAVKADPAYYTIELAKDGKTNTINIDGNGKVK